MVNTIPTKAITSTRNTSINSANVSNIFLPHQDYLTANRFIVLPNALSYATALYSVGTYLKCIFIVPPFI